MNSNKEIFFDEIRKNTGLVFFPHLQCIQCRRSSPIYIDQKNLKYLGWLVDISKGSFCSLDCYEKFNVSK